MAGGVCSQAVWLQSHVHAHHVLFLTPVELAPALSLHLSADPWKPSTSRQPGTCPAMIMIPPKVSPSPL